MKKCIKYIPRCNGHSGECRGGAMPISAFGRAVIRFGENRILEWTATATAYVRRTPDWPSQMCFGGNKQKKAIRIATCDVSAIVSDIGALFFLCAPLMTLVRHRRNCRAGCSVPAFISRGQIND